MHHGVILSGISGIGKREFAVALAKRLLCGANTEIDACGACQDCKLFEAGTHPDLHVIASEHEASEGRIALIAQYSDRYQDSVARGKKTNPSPIIPVDQIRILIDRFYQSSYISNNRVALILPADRMNANAANALLKLLEEPPSDTYFLLVTDQPGLLPATIRSRCVSEPLEAPAPDQARKWLETNVEGVVPETLSANISVGPIDVARDYQRGTLQQQLENVKRIDALVCGRADPIELAAQMTKQDITSLLLWMHKLVVDLLKWDGAGQVPEWSSQAKLNIEGFSTEKLYKLYDKLASYRRMARDQLNAQLALEEILISFQQSVRST